MRTVAATVADMNLYRWSALLIDGPALYRYAARCNWDEGTSRLVQIIRHPACSLATALLIYWRGRPFYFARYVKRSNVPEHERPQYDLLKAIERQVARKTYQVMPGTTFDPRRDGRADLSTEGVAVNRPPACMFVAVTARKIVPFAFPEAVDAVEPSTQPPTRKMTAVERTARGWKIGLELDYDWASEDNPQVDRTPRPRGLVGLCASLGPFPGLPARLEKCGSRRWEGIFSVKVRADGKALVRAHASDFGFPELRALRAALRSLRFDPAKRGERAVPFECLLSVRLEPTSPRRLA